MNETEFILMDVCKSTRALGLGCRADSPEAIRVGMEMQMQGHRITDAAEPVEPGDAVTKGYGDRTYSRPRLLWTNEAPTAEFLPATVELALSGYTFAAVVAGYHRDSDVRSCGLAPVGMGGQCQIVTASGTAAREFRISTDGIAFGGGYTAAGESNAYAIPLYIYGM